MIDAKDFFIEAFSSRFASTVELLDYLIEHNIIEAKTVEKWAIIQSYPIIRADKTRNDAIKEITKSSRLSEVRVRNIIRYEIRSFCKKK